MLGFLAISLFVLVGVMVAWMRICAGNACPSVDGLVGYSANQAAKVYAADGRLITDLGLERRTIVPLKDMAPAVVAAFVNTEDKRFYQHHGIDWHRVFGALADIVVKRKITGASTLTMQLAGNLWPDDINRRDRSVQRKLREMRVALEIERKLPKDRILELYLNQIDLGNRAYGVEAASQRYFGKSVRNLNVAEAATLAAIPKAPSRYNPRKNPNLSVQRRNVVINILRDTHKLKPADAERWKAYPLLLSSRSDFSGVAQYFVEYVRQQMYAKFGDDLYKQGFSIYTTLDLDMQQAAERTLEAQLQAVEKLPGYKHQTYRQYVDAHGGDADDNNRSTTPYLQGLVVTLDAKTGAIRALVGGRDFEDSKFNRAVQALRQPGSTFKPFVYSAAIRAGYPLSHVIVDEPFSLDVAGQATWTPQNYDLQFKGPHDLRWNLKESRNVPAIKLGMEIGQEAVIAEARRFGLTSPIAAVPAIDIGAADVYPMEMISAYTAFANLGTRVAPTAILRVEDRTGNIVWQPPVKAEDVMSAQHAWLMTSVLRDVVLNGSAAGSVGMKINFPAAGKTGTTNDGNDVWFIGFTPELVTGVWMGFDQPSKIVGNAQGGRLAAPAWTALMKEIYDRRPAPGGWARPDGLTVAEVDITTGYKATAMCPADVHYIESFIPGTEPGEYCPVHVFDPFGGAVGSSGQTPATPAAAPAPAPGAQR